MDLLNPINIDKSIKKGRLVYMLTIELILDYIFGLIATVLVLIGVYLYMFNATRSTSLWVAAPVFGILIMWMIANIVLAKRLIPIKQPANWQERRKLQSILNGYYPRLKSVYEDKNMAKYYQEPRVIGMSKLITIIYNKENIYLNISSLGKGDGPLPFSGLYNYIKARRIVKRLSSHE
jgi:hypothetical protein